MIEDKTVADLQDAVLRCVFRAEPLPGGHYEVRLPDPAFVLRHPEIYLLDKELVASIDIEHAGKSVRVISEQDLGVLLKNQSDIAFLQFRRTTADKDSVRITLEANLAVQDGVQRLSAVQVEFRQMGGEWSVVRHPVALAN